MLLRALSMAAGIGLLSAPSALAQGGGMMGMKAPTGKDATITGTVIDVSCKFGQGLTGADHRTCAQVCADKGVALGILTSDGKLYIPVSATMPGESENAKLKAFAEQKVTVKGKVFSAGGAEAIQITQVTKS